MKLDKFDYKLPKDRIAQEPKKNRSDSKLMVLSKIDQTIQDDYFFNLCNYLSKNDLVIFNNTKVIPARLYGSKSTGGKVEIFFERKISDYDFLAFIKNFKLLDSKNEIIISNTQKVIVEKKIGDFYHIRSDKTTVHELLDSYGNTPLPPYINRKPTERDKNRYQTIYSSEIGSTAAPTAGLHFDEKVFSSMKSAGIQYCFCTLHIGLGTFSPIRTENINDYNIHSEFYSIPAETVEKISDCKKNHGRVIAVGTTVLRALESFYLNKNKTPDTFYDTNLFIKPGFSFSVVDGLITNFHLPKSSLLVLIAAFYGLEPTLRAYDHAINNQYMFFSYGDVNLII